MKRHWLATLTFLLATTAAVHLLSAAEQIEQHCLGLLWCTERAGESVSTDGLLWLYTSEERATYSRLAFRPLYSMEEDPTRDLLRRSVLWPLGTYERDGDRVRSHVFPLFWHAQDAGTTFTFTVPFYLKAIDGDSSWHHLFPLFSRHVVGDYYARNFWLGPLLMTTSDTRTDLSRWDFLFPLGHHSEDLSFSQTRFAPLYWAGEDRTNGDSYRYVLPFYGSSESETQRYHFVFPFYGRLDDSSAQVNRFSLLGLPPMKGFTTAPSLSLVEHATTATGTSHRIFPLYRYLVESTDDRTFDVLLLYSHQTTSSASTDRFFPLYRYEHNGDDQTHEFGLLGYREASWFRYQDSPSGNQHRLLGLYSYDRSREDSWQFSLLGYQAGSLYIHRSQADLTQDRLVPFHDYVRTGETSSLSLLGISEVSLYRNESGPSLRRHRLFPLYTFHHHSSLATTRASVLFAYQHEESPAQYIDRLIPLWQYDQRYDQDKARLNALGIGPFSLYEHVTQSSGTSDRFFPFYKYVSNIETDDVELAILWPLAEYRSREDTVTSASLLWWLASYERSDAEHADFHLLGGPTMALVRRVVSPRESVFELNPVIPLYRYRHEADGDSSWDILGGVLGMETTPQETRFELFWMSL